MEERISVDASADCGWQTMFPMLQAKQDLVAMKSMGGGDIYGVYSGVFYQRFVAVIIPGGIEFFGKFTGTAALSGGYGFEL